MSVTGEAAPASAVAPASPASMLPTVRLDGRAAERVRHGALHIARREVTAGPTASADVVAVTDERGRPLGSALWANSGPLALRIWDRAGRPLDRSLVGERLAAADRRRQELYGGTRDAYRVVHGEADGLPGLFVDRYADAAVIQTATAAMDRRKDLIADLLGEVLGVSRVICRDDGSARDLEGLPRVRGVLRPAAGSPEAAARVRFHDAGSPMEADLLHDRKTGSFLDQQENHAAVADYARRFFPAGGQALDCFTYHGGFALALARAGMTTTACDEDPDAVARGRRNAALAGVTLDLHVANAFDLLRGLEASGRRFDVVVLDPPAFAKRGRTAGSGGDDRAAERAYKELNLRGLRLLAPGGLLATCSCSGRVSDGDFGALVESAARDVGCRGGFQGFQGFQILERRGAGRDHPVLLGMPETAYLKCWLLRASSCG